MITVCVWPRVYVCRIRAIPIIARSYSVNIRQVRAPSIASETRIDFKDLLLSFLDEVVANAHETNEKFVEMQLSIA